MDILKILAELRAEQQRLAEAILVVERLAIGSGAIRRGRPPKWMSTANAADDGAAIEERSTRRRFSAATRRKMAAAQKRRWAAKKLQKAVS